jgi:hypothetical protein
MILRYIAYAIAYILIGVAWSYLRWKRFVDNEVEFYESERQRFLNHHRIRGGKIPDHLVFEWRHHVEKVERLRDVPPKAHEYQGQIAFDFILWSVSMLLVMITQTVSAAMRVITAEYNKITQQKIDKIRNDLKG